MSEELKLEETPDDPLEDILSDLDLGELEDPVGDNGEKAQTSVLGQVGSSLKSTVTDIGRVSEMVVDKVLPKEVRNVARPLMDAKDKFASVIEEKTRGIRKDIQPIVNKMDKAVPQSGLRRKIFDKFKNLVSVEDSGPGYREPTIEERAATSTAEIFGEGADRVQEIVNQALQHDRDMASIDIQKQTLVQLSQLNNYTLQITHNYQRKSLELKFQLVGMMKQYVELFGQYAKDNQKQMEAVVTNTGLPDFAKLRTTAALKQTFRADINRKLVGKLYGETNYVDNLIENVSRKIGDVMSSIGDFVGMGAQVGDMAEMGGNPMADMAAEGVLGAGMGALRNKLGGNKKAKGWMNKMRYASKSLPDFLDAIATDESQTNFVGRGVRGLAGTISSLIKPRGTELRMDRMSDLSPEQLKTYDVRSKISLIEVIPGYLARILREVTFLSRGEETELLKYSFSSRSFTGESKMTQFIKSEFQKAGDEFSLSNRVDQLLEIMEQTAGQTLGLETKEKLRPAILRQAAEKGAAGLGRLNKSGFFDDLTEEETEEVKNVLQGFLKNSDDKSEAKLLFKEYMDEIRSSVPNVNMLIKDMIDRGQSDSLIDLGIMKPTLDGKVTVEKSGIYRNILRDAKMTELPEKEEETQQQEEEVKQSEFGQVLGNMVSKKITKENVRAGADAVKVAWNKFVPKPVRTVMEKSVTVPAGMIKSGAKASANVLDRTLKVENSLKNVVRRGFGKPTKEFKGLRIGARMRKMKAFGGKMLSKMGSDEAIKFATIMNLENEFGEILNQVSGVEDATPSDIFSVQTAKATATTNILLQDISNKLGGAKEGLGDKASKTKEAIAEKAAELKGKEPVEILKDISKGVKDTADALKKPTKKRFEDELDTLKKRAEEKKKRIKEKLEERKAKKEAKKAGVGDAVGKFGILKMMGSLLTTVKDVKGAITGGLGSLAETLAYGYAGKKGMDMVADGIGGGGKDKKDKKGKTKAKGKTGRFRGAMKRGFGKFGKLAAGAGALFGLSKMAEAATDAADIVPEGKEATNIAKKATGEAAGKAVEKTAVKKGATKAATKAAGKGIAKTLGKSALKKIPVLGALAGLGFAASRAVDGDWTGAGLELLSGLAGGSGLGFLASVGIDGYLAKRDMDAEEAKNAETSNVIDMDKYRKEKQFKGERNLSMDGDAEPSEIDQAGRGGSVKLTSKGIPLDTGPLVNPDADYSSYLELNGDIDIDGLNPATRDLFLAMAKEYHDKTGKRLVVNSAKRSSAQQAELSRKLGATAAKAGRSLHEFGLALDINTSDANALDELGLMRKYGFTRPLQGESWHIEPALVQFYLDKARKDPDFAAKITAMSIRKGGGGLGAITPKGKRPIRRDLAFAKTLLGEDISKTIASKGDDGGALVPVSNKTTVRTGDQEVAPPAPKKADVVKMPEDTKVNAKLTNEQKSPPSVSGEIVNKEIPGMSTTLSSVDKTLKSSLDVQTQILDILKFLKERAEKAGTPPQAPQGPSVQQASISGPAVSMQRTAYS